MRPERREDPLELKASTVRSLGWSERGMGRRKAGGNRSPAAESLVIHTRISAYPEDRGRLGQRQPRGSRLRTRLFKGLTQPEMLDATSGPCNCTKVQGPEFMPLK